MSLLIAVFAIMLLGILGWTVGAMLSADSGMNLRMFNSEKAMYAAEAGINWALNQLTQNGSWRTDTSDSDCNDTADWVLHSLPGVQYRVCCRNATGNETSTGDVAVQAQGYAPSYSGYQASRWLKILLRAGEFSKAVQARGIFDWSNMKQGLLSFCYIMGEIQAAYYDGDGDGVYNEYGVDYRSDYPALPPSAPLISVSMSRTVASDPYPVIDMPYYESAASTNLWTAPNSALIVSVATTDSGTRTELELSANIFPPSAGWSTTVAAGQILRNISRGHCAYGAWGRISSYTIGSSVKVKLEGVLDWQEGERVYVAFQPSAIVYDSGQRQYTVTFPVDVFTNAANTYEETSVLRRLVYTTDGSTYLYGGWDYQDWGVVYDVQSARKVVVKMDKDYTIPTSQRWDIPWNSGYPCWFSLARRFRGKITKGDGNNKNVPLWYIRSDALFDVRNRQSSWESGGVKTDVEFNLVGLVCEGDAVIRGTNGASFTKKPLEYPNLATKNGDIYSPDDPGSSSDRNFDDFPYSENGDVTFNYLEAAGVYGRNVYLSGTVRIVYDASAVKRLTGYSFSLGGYKWQEQ